MSRPAKIEIDLSALRHNFQQVRQLAPQAKVLAMVKANAYGHGLVRIANALSDADGFGVACIEEALFLRQAGIQQKIVLVEGFFTADELSLIAEYQLDTVIHNSHQLEILRKVKLSKPVNVWLKINTGMNRLGFLTHYVHQVYQQLQACEWVKQITLMTHFADADVLDKDTTQQQIKQFVDVAQNFECERSLANSAGILAWPQSHADWVRPGIMLYGVSPVANKMGRDYQLKPVMTLKSEIIAIHNLQRGDAVGYGGTWICPEDMRVGIIAMGYGDGYPRQAKNDTPILLNGKKALLIGRVSMDMISIDLRTQPDAKIGDPVVLWGSELPVEQISQASGIFSYELLCGVDRSYPIRVEIEEKNDEENN